jgi:hypothetical protein
MSTTPANSTTNGQTRVAIQQVAANQVNVTVNGVKYRVSLFNSTNNTPISIGNKYNWEEVAKEATQIALNLINKTTIEKASLILEGIPENIETLSPAARTVTFVEAQIEHKEGTQVVTDKFEGSKIAPQLQAKIDQNIKTIGQTFAKEKPVSSKSNAPGSKQRPPELVDVTTDPKAELCKDRPKIQQANIFAALAHQLASMPHDSPYHGKPVATIQKELREKYADEITKNGKKYIEGDLFSDIFNALKKATTDDRNQLQNVTTSLTSNKFLGNKIKSNFNQVEVALADQPQNLSKERKKELITIYAAYVKDENSRMIAKDSFLNTFAAIFSQGEDPAMFQVVITEENSNAQAPLNSKHYPEKDKIIFTHRCAFIHLAKDNSCHSYNRAAKAGSPSLQDLNTPHLQVDAARKTEKKPKPSTLPTIQVDAAGRCLDKSIAYQILLKTNRGMKTNDPLIEQLADYLRTEAAKQINDHGRDKDVLFFNSLCLSIKEIPAFSTNSNYTDKDRTDSLNSIKAIATDPEIEEIKQILNKSDYDSTPSKEKKLLREFYSKYTTQKGPDGKMSNYLDSAFLCVLPLIDLKKHDNTINAHYQYAVLQGDALHAQYPQNSELRQNDAVFVLYNGFNHYVAVDMTAGNAQIDLLIKKEQRELLERLIDLAENSSADATKEYLLETIQHQHTQAYIKLKRLIYDYDVKVWTANAKKGSEPGTVNMTHNGITYQHDDYGNYKLHAIEPDELQGLLTNQFRQALLNDPSLK